ncbi:hypothetical protein Tco_0723947 [Tanacetum coccineum]
MNRASTSANPEPARVEGVWTELEYSNEEYDEEIEAEPRHSNPLRSNETTPARRNGRRELSRRIELGNKWPGEGQGVNLPPCS